MRCVIIGESVKLFAKAIHCLAKIGDEIYVEPLKKGLSLRTVSSSRSAYACFVFMISFFQSYDDGSSSHQDDNSPGEALKCKLSVKSCLSVFKSLSTIERNVERCSIKMSDGEEQLTFLLYCRHGVTKTYNLSYQDCESLQAVFTKDLCPNLIIIQPSMLSEVVMNFHSSQEEISLTVCPQNMTVTNYVDEDQDHEKVINTKMVLVAEEFEKFQIGVDSEVTFCLKELKGILTFAESSDQNMDIHFESGGKPIVFSLVSNPTFEATFVLATLMDQPGTQSSQQRKPESLQKSSKTKDTSRQTSSPTRIQSVVLDDDEFGLNEDDEGDWANDVIAVEEQLAKETLEGNHVVENDANGDFGDSFPSQDVSSKKARSVQPSNTQSSKNNQSSWVKHVRTPSSYVPSDLVQKCAEMPAFGGSLSADSENSPGIAVRSGKDKIVRHEKQEGNGNVLDEEKQSQDSVPGTPPSKKFKSMLFSAMSGHQRFMKKTTVEQNESIVLVADSDDEDD